MRIEATRKTASIGPDDTERRKRARYGVVAACLASTREAFVRFPESQYDCIRATPNVFDLVRDAGQPPPHPLARYHGGATDPLLYAAPQVLNLPRAIMTIV